MIRLTLLVTLFCLGFVSCSRSVEKTPAPPENASRPTQSINKRKEWLKDLAALATAPSPDIKFDVIRYSPQLSYITTESGARLEGHVDILFRTLETLSSVSFNANLSSIDGVETAEGKALSFNYSRESGIVEVYFSTPMAAGNERTLRIHYTALANDPQSYGLNLYTPVPLDDPNPHSVLYTKTEPQGTSGWMPSQDRPDDRASLRLEMKFPQELSLVSNGLLIKDQFQGSSRTMAWETQIAIPTYLMAFAVSQFQHTSQWHQGLELSIWSRQGFPVNAHALLEETRRQMTLFEGLMVPYPFEKYALVLIPNFRGGMEHASVTFNDERSSSVADNQWDRYLMAHELGHQWFGDLVTIRSWDDLWIKEGMATLLAYEALRSTEGLAEKDSALGEYTWFVKNAAILDPQLPPDRKYTSGPYDRAAWWLTQLREEVGIETFWLGLRKILQDFRFKAISSDEFLSYFEPHMSPESFARFVKALVARDVPKLKFSNREDSMAKGHLSLELVDLEGALPLPVQIEILSEGGTQIHSLQASTKIELPLPSKESSSRIVFDPKDQHPSFWAFVAEESPSQDFSKWIFESFWMQFVPQSEKQWKNWASDSRWSVRIGALAPLSLIPTEELPSSFQSDLLKELLETSSSVSQTYLLLDLACRLNDFPIEVIHKQIRTLKLTGSFDFGKSHLKACAPHAETVLRGLIDKTLFEETASQLQDREALLLQIFGRPEASDTKALWESLSKWGATLRQRRIGQSQLREE